jgi:hypothetical protein
MSTLKGRRPRPTLPDWLTAPRRAALARSKDGKPVRVTFQLTEAQRKGLDRVLKAAERERVQLSEGDVMRVALDELLATVERAAVEPEQSPEPAEPKGEQ